jgi:hypothetical protein
MRPARTAAPLAALLLLAGCSDTFVPPSVVEDLRVMALVASPPELGPPGTGPAQAVTVRAVLAAPPPGAPGPGAAGLTERWQFCPLSAGASRAYACAVEACQVDLTPVDRTVTVEPLTEIQRCLAALGGTLPSVPDGSAIPASFEVLVRYEVRQGTAVTRQAVQRIPIWTGAQAPPAGWTANRPPVIAGVTIGAVPATPCPDPADTSACAPAATLTRAAELPVSAAIDPGSLDSTVDANGRAVRETVVVWFFTTAGRFTEERGQDPLATTALKAESLTPGTSQALLWVVARDLRGGEAVAGPFRVSVTP